MSDSSHIESILHESRMFPPSEEFSKSAHIKSFEEYERIYNDAARDPEAFWAKQAESLGWFRKWDTILEWNEPFAKWFVGGKLNISYNCLDRHLVTHRRDKTAIIWEGACSIEPQPECRVRCARRADRRLEIGHQRRIGLA